MRAFAGVLAMILCTVIANLGMKLGSRDDPSPLLLGLMSWRTALGLLTFGVAGLCYAAVLKSLPLNIAQSFAAFQFVAVIVSARLVLGEPIPSARWVGISLIMAGILVVASDEMR